jgi:NTP pyrophosphatase (non-canonical NTP hydrolase)
MSYTERKLSATISGSFNKDFVKIQKKVRQFQNEGIEVLAPPLSKIVGNHEGFVTLEHNKGAPHEIESDYLDAISRSDFLYVVNSRGYIGRSVALEIGYAVSKGIPIYSMEKPKDITLSFFVKPKKSIKAIKRELTAKPHKIFSKTQRTLKELQEYVDYTVKIRGFEKETIEHAMLLLVEEVGELAKATRNLLGIKSSRKADLQKNVRAELADCLIYLLDISNLAKVDLEHAFLEKEKRNHRRKWHYGTV